MSATPHDILKQYWGYDQFRPLQEDIIESIIDKKDTLALLPTGGGKSICFQVPALCLEGICIVVTPLIALMKDQVMNLRQRGIKANALFSGMHPNEIDRILDNCVYGDVKFLYVSPERLETELFIERFKKMTVNIIAVDEAHCISQWGYDFRSSYLNIKEIRQWNEAPMIALTATATPQVVEDIQDKLEFPEYNAFQKSFERENLTYAISYTENKVDKMLELLGHLQGTGIVYANTRRETKTLAGLLNKNGLSANYYHAGLDPLEKDKIQQAWLRDKTRIIVSTNAFGMGIDKPDVRWVMHFAAPPTLEGYFQEAGRGGRDGKRSISVILVQDGDAQQIRERVEYAFPPKETVRNIYRGLGNYLNLATGSGQGQEFAVDPFDFIKKFSFSPRDVFAAFKILNDCQYITFSEAQYLPSRVQIKANTKQLYDLQLRSDEMNRLIQVLLRSYGNLFDGLTKIDEKLIAGRAGLTLENFQYLLKKLDQNGSLQYIPATELPRIFFNEPMLPAKGLRIDKAAYDDKRKLKMEKADSVSKYIHRVDRCRSRQLLEYFGEIDTFDCGRCDVCRRKSNLKATSTAPDEIAKLLLTFLDSASHSFLSLKKLTPNIPEENMVDALRLLVDEEKVIVDLDGNYALRADL